MPAAPVDVATLSAAPRTTTAIRRRALLGLLVLVTLAAYYPALRGGFVWDDDAYVTQNPTLRDVEGLRRIWFELDAVPQYYPLVHTAFWVEYHLWGAHPLGYHVVNVLLHVLAAALLARILLRLEVPGAGLAAALFALHPVCVEIGGVDHRAQERALGGVLPRRGPGVSALLRADRFR